MPCLDGIDAALTARRRQHRAWLRAHRHLIDRVVKQDVYWCPPSTWASGWRRARGIWPEMVPNRREAFAKALKRGVRIAYAPTRAICLDENPRAPLRE